MVPAGCLECFSLQTSSPQRRRLAGWGSLGHGAEGREKTASLFCLRVQTFPAEEGNWCTLVLLFSILFSASSFIPMCQTACRLYFRGPRNLNYRPKYLKHLLIYKGLKQSSVVPRASTPASGSSEGEPGEKTILNNF